MAQTSAIEWTDATWNPVVGCSKVSPGCAHCYAETLSTRFGWTPHEWTPEHAAENVILKPERLDQPFSWRKPRMVFVNSMSDLFHELVPEEFVWRVFDVMRRCPQHTFQILTKRPERAREVVQWIGDRRWSNWPWPLPNVWLGVSIENARFTWRADVLREIPAAVRFISAEPLLGSLFESGGIVTVRPDGGPDGMDVMLTRQRRPLDLTGIDWLIVGGESGGREARPMHPAWARELRNACLAPHDYALDAIRGAQYDGRTLILERPAFFFKQWGSWAPGMVWTMNGEELDDTNEILFPDGRYMRYAGAGPKSGGRELDGRTWDEMPVPEAVAA